VIQQHNKKATECKLKKNKGSNIHNQTLQETGTINHTLVNSNVIHGRASILHYNSCRYR